MVFSAHSVTVLAEGLMRNEDDSLQGFAVVAAA
jgi:hypothetical protein